LINLNLKIKQSDRLYYDKFKYAITIKLPNAQVLRNCTKPTYLLSDIPDRVKRATAALRETYTTWRAYSTFYSDEEKINAPSIHTEREILQLTEIATLIKQSTDLRISANHNFLSVYVNDLRFINNIESIPVSAITVVKMRINRKRNTLRVINTHYKKRIYFKNKMPSSEDVSNIRNFVNTYDKSIRLGNSLSNWFFAINKFNNITDLKNSFYIDVKDDKLSCMFNIMAPGHFRMSKELIGK